MPTLDASVFKRKMRERMIKIKLTIPQILQQWGEETYKDIESGSDLFVPSWKAAFRADGTGQYFKPIKPGGLFEAIRDNKVVQVVSYKQNRYKIGLGSQVLMDASTSSDSGFPYWRLFEYGTIGSRSGGSDTYGYVPFGKGNGYMDTVSPLGRATRPHPGVLPVFLFSDTVRAKRMVLYNRLKTRIVDIVKKG